MKAQVRVATAVANDQNRHLQKTFEQERGRLLNFIRARVPEEEDAEDILQDVFFQLVETYRLMKPVEQLSAWLFTVARNKITDLFRKKKPQAISRLKVSRRDEDTPLLLTEILPDLSGGPENEFTRHIILEELAAALADLPREQREVFVWHEMEGRSFNEIAEETGVALNTLLSRKRYAVLFLRERLKQLYLEFVKDQ